MAQLANNVTFNRRTMVGGPDAFTESYNQWEYIYLFPPPATLVMSRVVHRLQSYRGKTVLIALYWLAQPWFLSSSGWHA
ncbi:hypothetical protein E2C01_055657 [Portunus trituberculatus]|uniref:Uncharacterized protein n=1 Tax=Portunus trituberculatus TaxID=210409 RepID=A0A5B7GVD4_PORTR|nr:hypothetical protein [Portunus trituberculatus]